MSQPFQYSLDGGVTWERAGAEGVTVERVKRGTHILVQFWGEPVSADDRRSIPQGEEPAKGAAQGDELTPLPEPAGIMEITDDDDSTVDFVDSYTADQMREYGAACRAGEKADARDAALVTAQAALKYFVTFVEQERMGGKPPYDVCKAALRQIDAARSHTGGKEEGVTK